MTPLVRVFFALTLSFGFSLVAGGCRQKEKETSAAPTPKAAPSPEAPVAPTPARGPSAPLTEEDFEAEAARTIHGDNLEAALDEIEKGIQAK
jgi:hypothetical protein